MATWYNSDGLLVKIGTVEATPSKTAEYTTFGPTRMVEVELAFGDITSADTVLDYGVVIPTGAYIEKVEFYVHTAFTGSSSTLNVGGYKVDNTAVETTGGFISALALASMTPAGVLLTFTSGVTSKGSYVGTALTADVWLSTKWGTAAFTAGKAAVRIFYSWPNA